MVSHLWMVSCALFSLSSKTFNHQTPKLPKPWDWMLKWSNSTEIWNMPQQQCWQDTCQISHWSENSNSYLRFNEMCWWDDHDDLTLVASAAWMRQWFRSALVQIMAWLRIDTMPLSKPMLPGLLSIGTLGTNFSEIWIEIQIFSLIKMHLKRPSVKWRPFCTGRDELNHWQLCCHLNRFKQQITWISFALLARWNGNPLVTSGFPSQRVSNVESVSMSWYRHDGDKWHQPDEEDHTLL